MQVPGGPQVAVGGFGPNVEASPSLNALDIDGLKIPTTCLCFGSRCGAWQWSTWHRGRDGKHYITRGEAKSDAFPLTQMGYCGKAAPMSQDIVPPSKPTSLPAPDPANEGADTKPPAEGAPEGETLQ